MAMGELWKRNWVVTLKRVWAEMVLDDCFGAAAQLAYYFLLAFFPFIIFLVALVAFLPIQAGEEATNVAHRIQTELQQLMPEQAWDLVGETVAQVVRVVDERRGKLLYISIIGALLVASTGIRAVMTTLNRAYSVREGRSFWHRYALSIGLTIALSVTAIVAALLLSLSDWIGVRVTERWGAVLATAWHVGARVLGFGALIYILELIYHVAPNVRRPWHWVTPGSLFSVLLWLLAIRMFTFYVGRFGQYDVMYAGLGAVVVFLLWLYITGLAILVGGELNAELERSSGMLAPVAVPAPESVDAAGHDTTLRDAFPAPDIDPNEKRGISTS